MAQIVLFQADWQESEWNRLAAATADVVLLVANAADKPQISMLETVRLVCEPSCGTLNATADTRISSSSFMHDRC